MKVLNYCLFTKFKSQLSCSMPDNWQWKYYIWFYLCKLPTCSKMIWTGLQLAWQQVVSCLIQWSLRWEQKVCIDHKCLFQQIVQNTSSLCSSSFQNLEMGNFLQRMLDRVANVWLHSVLWNLYLLSWLQYGWLTEVVRKWWESQFLLLFLILNLSVANHLKLLYSEL